MLKQSLCPCGSNQSFHDCCNQFISGQYQPGSAEQLMRSRYTAYTLADGEYLHRTYHPDYRGDNNPVAIAQNARQVNWKRLEVVTAQGEGTDEVGEVEFKAWYEYAGKLAALHERSQFIQMDGQWFYTSGDFKHTDEPGGKRKIGRNDACPCGSGKKYKKCCG